VRFATYDQVKRARAHGDAVSVPMVRTNDWTWASYVGNDAYFSGPWLAIEAIAAAVGFVVARARYGNKYAWYDRTKVVEQRDSGPWIETRPTTPIDPGVD
jgi:hypothetical protein